MTDSGRRAEESGTAGAGKAAGTAGADAAGHGAAEDALAEFKELFAEQRERQAHLRHVQQFLKSPLFLDLREEALEVADSPEALEERKRDLDYRLRVLQSLLTLMTEERAALDRMVPVARNGSGG